MDDLVAHDRTSPTLGFGGSAEAPLKIKHPIHTLTRAERRILALLSEGKRNPEIARQLYISVNTVKTHLQHIFRKMRVTNRREAAYVYGSFLRRLG